MSDICSVCVSPIKLKINNKSCQHLVKTRTDALAALMKAGVEAVKKCGTLSLSLISGVLIVLFIITGCSDVPYTGPMLTIDHVDRYLDTIGEDTVCIEDGFDIICIKLLPEEDSTEDDAPIVHVHPTRISYVFYYKQKPILRVEREMDTTEIVQDLIDAGRIQLPPDTGDQEPGANTVGSWIIQIYYPDAFPEARRGQTPKTSGLDIRVVQGMKIRTNKRNDLQIMNFTQTDDADGSRSIRFSVETKKSEITIQVNGLVPDNTATFHIRADDVASGGGTNTLELKPL